MRRIQLAITTLLGLLALAAIAGTTTATAFETTKILPTPTATEPLSATITILRPGGALVALGGEKISCRSGLGSVNFTTENLGTGAIEYKECTTIVSSLEVKCWGEADRVESGIILVTGTVHYWLALEMLTSTTTTLVGAFVILQAPFHFKCGIEGIATELILVRGCQASRDDSNERLTKEVVVLAKQWATGETRILEVLPENSSREIKCLPESERETRGFTLSALEGEALISSWLQKGREVTVLLHN